MKKKEFTKFLALMMSAAMVAGSGVPVTAADFSSDDVVVETTAESDDAETADEADDAQIELGGVENEEPDTASEDTDEVIISEDENETYTDAFDVFSDGEEETDILADDTTTVKPDFNVTLNGKASTLNVTDKKETEDSNEWQVVDVTFNGEDTNDANNVSVNLPEGTTVTKTNVGRASKYINDNRGFPKRVNGDPKTGPFAADMGDSLNSTSWYVVQIYSDGTHKYYKLNFHINVEKSDLQGTVRLDAGAQTGTAKDLTFDADSKSAECTFESSEASETENNVLTFNLQAKGIRKIEMGTSYDANKDAILEPITVGEDGTCKLSFGRGNGPAAKSTTYHCVVTYQDDEKVHYTIKITRKGRAGASYMWGGSKDNPFSMSTFDNNSETISGLISSLKTAPITIYDENGKSKMVTPSWTFYNLDEEKDNFYFSEDGSTLYAKKPGIGEFGEWTYNGTTYKLYAQAKYGSGAAKTLLEKYGKGGKDGNVSISACEKAEEFTGLFPENMKQDAEDLYNLIKELNTAVNIGSDKEGGWDYSITGNTGAVWTDDCESARLSKAIELAKAVWPHIYGLQDAKDALNKMVESAPGEKQAELKKIADAAIAELDKAYNEGTLTVDMVNETAKETTRKLQEANPTDVANCEITLDQTEYVYDGQAKEPEVTVKNGDEVVAADEYTVEYKNNTDAGTATVAVTGKGILTGNKEVTFTIAPAEQEVTVPVSSFTKTEGDAAFALNASGREGAVLTYSSSDAKIVSVDAEGNVTPLKAGTATITVKASAKNYKDATASVNVTVIKKVLNVTKTSVTKTEGNKAFSLGVKTNVKATVTYKTSNKNVATVNKKGKVTVKGPGRAVITVTGKASGRATETVKITVTVKPSAKLSAKATALKGKKAQVTWKRNKKATGYQIVVATDKSFKNVVKTVNIKKNKTVKTSVKGLKKGKKYYVRVRSYKKASGGNVYSSWSKAKPVKAKK
ncbi:Bacterial Ig-like domain (group 2) [uncultured Ruminococcus sp.]|nr:Bacterial Ig-like domain (group 2) [uncultured Ruminococcus sp.]